MRRWSSIALALGVASAAHALELRLIGMRRVPPEQIAGTTVGGLSGLDYDAAADRWFAISDDKSSHGPARCVTLRLDYDERGFTAASAERVIVLRQPDGSPYPDATTWRTKRGDVADFEAVRLDPRDGSLWYASEGDQALGLQPFVRHADRDGKYLGTLPLAAQLSYRRDATQGVRGNNAFEGIAFAPDGDSLWIGLEAPLIEDGPVPSASVGAPTRVTRFGRDGAMREQFVYPLGALQVAPVDGKLADNGLSEILALPGDRRLLALERTGAEQADGSWKFTAQIYEADFAGATNVAGRASLVGGPAFRAGRKRLVFDFAAEGRVVDNIEGLAWGRRLKNGRATLVAVSDDNFAAAQQTQVWVFEATPAWDEPFAGVVHDARRIHGFVAEYRWLSNYQSCRVTWEGRTYGSAEAAYQSAKYPTAERDVFTTLEPDPAKKLARTKPYDAAAWETRKLQAMRAIVAAKFNQNPELAKQLLATGDRDLEETNWWGDAFWGVADGKGDNMLGKILMETRARLAAETKR